MPEKYPKQIFVQEEADSEPYLIAHKKIEQAEDGEIAVYELKKIGNKVTKKEIVIE